MDDTRPFFTRRLGSRQLVALDSFVAAAYGVGAFSLTPGAPGGGWAWLVAAGAALPLAVRRRWPLPVFAVVLAASVAGVFLGIVRDPLVAAAFAVYPVALGGYGQRWVPTSAIAAFSGVSLLLFPFIGGPGWQTHEAGLVVLGAVVIGAAWTLGAAVRERRAYAAREAAQLAHQAVTDERLRIARELHDVVAHSMSLIAVKAAVANHVAQARPEEAHDALRVIETTSRGALTEIRHLLGVLRSEVDFSPVGLTGIPALVERAGMAGVHIDVHVEGVDELPDAVELSVYRILQEAVTNVVKHAAPARCRVAVTADGREVRVEVTDDGPGHRVLPGDTGGHGLIGMHERVTMFGGTFTAGPRPEGGFRVFARLPLEVP